MSLPGLYAICDAQLLHHRGWSLRDFAQELRQAGVTLVQYRNKAGTPAEVLRDTSVLSRVFEGAGATLILNDRADLAVLAGWNGVHVGQGDLSPEDARRVIGQERIIGVSTHTEEQVQEADFSCADYLAIGPVFATGTKADAAPVVGLEGVRRARSLTRKPLVAIGGINLSNAQGVLDAGADSVAVISGLLSPTNSVAEVARDFLELLR